MTQQVRLITILTGIALAFTACQPKVKETKESTLKDAFANMFYVGTALDSAQIIGADTSSLKLVLQQFNAIVAENVMKSEVIQPREGEFNFELADKMVEFGEKNNMLVTGHTLIWHSQLPKWFCEDEKGNNVSPEVLKQRMKTHIDTLVSRYKGRIHGWDVVNETILDNGSWRNSKFYEILGEDFVKLAFEYAHAADPEAELYYNDYSMAIPAKRDGVVAMVKKLQEQGVKIDGIGMQGHIGLDYPAIEEFEKSLLAFSALGVKVMITEMDITVLPSPRRNMGADVSLNIEYNKELNPYKDALPDSVSNKLNQRYLDFFKLYIKHSDKISRVTLWGVTDAQSWRNYWPVYGRTDYPLLFDRNYEAKPAVQLIIDEAIAAKKLKQ